MIQETIRDNDHHACFHGGFGNSLFNYCGSLYRGPTLKLLDVIHMTTETKELQAQRERYNSGRDNKELASRNREAFKTILNTMQLNDNAEVPMITVTMMDVSQL